MSGTGWQIVSNIDAVHGRIAIELYSSTPIISTDPGALVNIDFHASAGTPQTGLQVHLVNAVHIGGQSYGTTLADTDGGLVVSLVDAVFAQWA